METPPQMATAAGSTHPTGMHSCFHFHSDFGKNYAKTRIHSRRNDRQTDTPRQRSHETERPPPLDRDPPQTEIPLDSDTPGQRPPWTETPSHVTCAVLGQRPPRKQNHNHRQVSKHYLPATSFAGGKSRLAAQTSGFPSGKSCIPRGDRHTDSL